MISNVVMLALSLAFMWFLTQFVRQESRRAVMDYANRLRLKQNPPTKTPYDDFCESLQKELSR